MEEAEILLRPEWEQAMREEGNFACFSTKGRRKGKEELEERRLYIMRGPQPHPRSPRRSSAKLLNSSLGPSGFGGRVCG